VQPACKGHRSCFSGGVMVQGTRYRCSVPVGTAVRCEPVRRVRRGNQRGRLKDCRTSPGSDGSFGVPHKSGWFCFFGLFGLSGLSGSAEASQIPPNKTNEIDENFSAFQIKRTRQTKQTRQTFRAPARAISYSPSAISSYPGRIVISRQETGSFGVHG
jgi:hypothetical protein